MSKSSEEYRAITISQELVDGKKVPYILWARITPEMHLSFRVSNFMGSDIPDMDLGSEYDIPLSWIYGDSFIEKLSKLAANPEVYFRTDYTSDNIIFNIDGLTIRYSSSPFLYFNVTISDLLRLQSWIKPDWDDYQNSLA